jgi:hypothetical protein
MTKVSFREGEVDGFKALHRTAGSADVPVLWLLHSFPGAGDMFH